MKIATKEKIGNLAWGDSNQRGDIFSIYFYHKLAAPVVQILLKTKITPNQVTYFGLIPALTSIVLIATGKYPMLLFGALFLQIAQLCDYVDGTLAKVKHAQSAFGEWSDGFVDTIKIVGWYFAFAIGYYNQQHNLNVFFLLAVFLGVKVLTDYTTKAFVSCFNEEGTPLNKDMQQNLISRFPFLKRVPIGLVRVPVGGGIFPVLLTIGLLLNQLLLPFYIYVTLHILNGMKTVAYIFIKYRKQ